MNSDWPRKRRRREVPPKPANARLVFDDSTKGEAAWISENLWSALGLGNVTNEQPAECFIAVAPISPLHKEILDSTWTILPVQSQQSRSTDSTSEQQAQIKLSPTSPSCQSLLRSFTAVDHSRPSSHIPKQIEVRVIVSTPLVLGTVYVTVEKGLLEKVDDIQNRFGGGFHHGRHKKSNTVESLSNATSKDATQLQDRLTSVVREGLSKLKVIHSGDIFALPLPAHPITHVRPAPAIAVECEPVSQGCMASSTKVVVIQAGSSQEKALRQLATPAPILEESLEDTAEDTSNDQFFSAAEDRQNGTASGLESISEDDSATENSTLEDSGDDSDSMDDMISLSAPRLPPQPAGTLSAMTAATPRPGGYRASGTHTPGSMYSSFTTATAKAGSRPGKVFRTEALLRKIPPELLHPRPNRQDDDESSVYVDTSTLAKIGCFSGDWVRIEIARNVSSFAFPPSALTGLNGYDNDEESDWRAVKIYGLSGVMNQKPRYAVDKTGERRSSITQSHAFLPTTPSLYLSPVLLTNLSNAQFVKVGALPKTPRPPRPLSAQRLPQSIGPPLAREITLLRVLTPLTQSKEVQSTLFSSLKNHFETRRRVLKRGDMIAVPIDEELGRTTSGASVIDVNPGEEDLNAALNTRGTSDGRRIGTAWFYVQSLEPEVSSDQEIALEAGNWGQVATVDPSHTRNSVTATSSHTVPTTIDTWSKYWLGNKSIPQRSNTMQDMITTSADLPILEKLPLERRISDLVAASTSPRAISMGLPPLVILLHSNQRQIGKTYIATSACASVGVHSFILSGHDLLSENASTTGGGDVKTEGLLRVRAERALSCGVQQTALLIQHIDVLTADRMVPTLQDIIATSRVVIATTTKLDDIPAGIRSLFTQELEVGAPDEVARESILRNACMSAAVPLSPSINLKNIALQTAALVAGDLLDVVNRASIARSNRLTTLADEQSRTLFEVLVSGGQATTHLIPSDFSVAIAAARSTFSDAIGAPKIPAVTWADVGGLASQKDAIMETISLPLTRPELFANGIRKRSGILFYGPPGTGKTLLAKAIATEFSLNFFSVKGPELLNMYIGESEANVRRVFQRARDARPCVVFFDELDSVAPKRGNQGDSGGVMDRIVSQLLAELDGMSGGSSQDDGTDSKSANSSGGGVFVIGATNRPDLLDPALLRPGRFDKMLYLGVADSHESQVTIMEALTRKFALAPSVDLKRVASRLPFTYTGADLYALCSDAMLKAITRKTQAVDNRVRQISSERGEEVSTGWFFDHAATEEDIQVVVEEADFALAQRELVGSVSAKELEHFERIRGLFEEMDVGAEEKAREKKQKQQGLKTASAGQRPQRSNVPDLKTPKGRMIANPDSEADSDGFGNDYGVASKAAHVNGAAGNGAALTNGSGSTTTRVLDKGKGKAKAKNSDFQDDPGDDDEELYD